MDNIVVQLKAMPATGMFCIFSNLVDAVLRPL